MKIINLKKKNMKLMTKEQQESYEIAKICYMEDKKYCKIRNHCNYAGEYRGAAHSICNLKYSITKNVVIVFTMDQKMTIILSQNSQQKSLKNSLLV